MPELSQTSALNPNYDERKKIEIMTKIRIIFFIARLSVRVAGTAARD